MDYPDKFSSPLICCYLYLILNPKGLKIQFQFWINQDSQLQELCHQKY